MQSENKNTDLVFIRYQSICNEIKDTKNRCHNNTFRYLLINYRVAAILGLLLNNIDRPGVCSMYSIHLVLLSSFIICIAWRSQIKRHELELKNLYLEKHDLEIMLGIPQVVSYKPQHLHQSSIDESTIDKNIFKEPLTLNTIVFIVYSIFTLGNLLFWINWLEPLLKRIPVQEGVNTLWLMI